MINQRLHDQNEIQGKRSADPDGFNINLNNGGSYNILCRLYHWDDEQKTKTGEPVIISPVLLYSLSILDSLFFHYKQLKLSYYSGLESFLENSDSRNNTDNEPLGGQSQRIRAQATSTPQKSATFDFYGGGKDRIHISFYSISESIATDPYYSQNAIVDDDFVIIKKEESPTDQLNNPINKTISTLYLVPVAIYDLMTTFPQWTTGFDKWSEDAEFDKVGDVKSGVFTGDCIKQLLEKCNKEIDDNEDSWNEGIAKINFTSILNNSAFDSICHLLDYHSVDDGWCVFKWNEFLQKFQLRPMCNFFYQPISDSLNLLSISKKKTDSFGGVNVPYITMPPMQTNIQFITEDMNMYLTDSINRAPKISVSRHKSTFSLNFDQYKDKENIMPDGYLFFNEMSQDKVNFEYNKTLCQGMARSFFDPHYRTGERKSYNQQQVLRYFNSFGISYTRPGIDGRLESGKLFTARSIDGATTEIDKKINGIYLISQVLSEIEFTTSRYNCFVVGFKNKQANQGGFKIGAEEANPYQLPPSSN